MFALTYLCNIVPVIGQFGHCNQDLVNLLLTGKATSNVMDGEVLLGDSGLSVKGIFNRSSTGYLSHLESLRYCQVLDVVFPCCTNVLGQLYGFVQQ
jgi:hypothetical protein